MRGNLAGAVWRLAVFMTVCVLGVFVLLAVFAQLRFEKHESYRAIFVNASGLKGGDLVRVAGVEVGKVDSVTMTPDTSVEVKFWADDSVVLTQGNRAVIRYADLIGGRYLELEEGAGGTATLHPGGTIPLAQTQPALDLDAVIGGFRPLFRALEPEQVNALTGQLIRAFQGQGGTVGSILSQTGSLTNTLSDRDKLIGEVIDNLDTVLGTIGDQSQQFDKAVDSLSQIAEELAARKTDVRNAVGYANESAATVADMLQQARPPFREAVAQLDRTAGLMVADHDYLDNLLANLPERYQALGRLGLYGDYFTFYLCDLVLKVNGKGGQPVYVMLAKQTTGRCAPK